MTTTTLAANITNYDATPPGVVHSKLDGGFERTIVDTVEVPVTTANDFIILARVPVDAILASVVLGTDDLGTTGIGDLGYYKKNADGSYTAVDVNNLASGLDLNAAAVAPTERRFTAHDISTIQQKVWELAGLSARPSYDYLYIALTTTTATQAIGTASIKVKYIL